MRTIFVTGAEGFVGTHLLQYLQQRGYDVVAGVRNRARKLVLERRLGKALVCEVSDAINVARAIASVKPDGVIHLAGASSVHEAAEEPLTAYQSIVTAWANVLDGVRRIVPRAKTLLVSACEVYGNACPNGQPLTEDMPAKPTNTFGSLKAAAEAIAHTFFRNYHLNVTIARPFHHTGPGQSTKFFCGSVAKRMAEWDSQIHGRQLQLPDLACQRDLLHVQDVVAAYERVLQDGKPNEVYNVCSGRTWTCREIAEMIVKASGQSVQITEMPVNEEQPTIPALCGGNSKICNELGWKPTRSAESAIQELVQSCRLQPAQAAS